MLSAVRLHIKPQLSTLRVFDVQGLGLWVYPLQVIGFRSRVEGLACELALYCAGFRVEGLGNYRV